MPLCDEFITYGQNFDFKIRRDHQKKVPMSVATTYESVDEKSLSKAMSRKTTKKRIRAQMG